MSCFLSSPVFWFFSHQSISFFLPTQLASPPAGAQSDQTDSLSGLREAWQKRPLRLQHDEEGPGGNARPCESCSSWGQISIQCYWCRADYGWRSPAGDLQSLRFPINRKQSEAGPAQGTVVERRVWGRYTSFIPAVISRNVAELVWSSKVSWRAIARLYSRLAPVCPFVWRRSQQNSWRDIWKA